MSREFLDRYSRGHSPLHRWDVRWKLLVALALIVVLAFVPPARGYIAAAVPVAWLHVGAAVLLFAGFRMAEIPLSYVARRLAAVLPFLALLGLSLLLTNRQAQGWDAWLAVVLRGLLSFATVLLLINTTPVDRLLVALRRWGVPALFVAILSFMYRYLFLLLDELARMRRARQARTFHRSALAVWRTSGSLIGMLLVRSFERSERVHAAMQARGGDGTMKSLD